MITFKTSLTTNLADGKIERYTPADLGFKFTFVGYILQFF